MLLLITRNEHLFLTQWGFWLLKAQKQQDKILPISQKGHWLHGSTTVFTLAVQGLYGREYCLPASWMTVSTTTASRKAQGGIKQGFQHSSPSAGLRIPHPVPFPVGISEGKKIFRKLGEQTLETERAEKQRTSCSCKVWKQKKVTMV